MFWSLCAGKSRQADVPFFRRWCGTWPNEQYGFCRIAAQCMGSSTILTGGSIDCHSYDGLRSKDRVYKLQPVVVNNVKLFRCNPPKPVKDP